MVSDQSPSLRSHSEYVCFPWFVDRVLFKNRFCSVFRTMYGFTKIYKCSLMVPRMEDWAVNYIQESGTLFWSVAIQQLRVNEHYNHMKNLNSGCFSLSLKGLCIFSFKLFLSSDILCFIYLDFNISVGFKWKKISWIPAIKPWNNQPFLLKIDLNFSLMQILK